MYSSGLVKEKPSKAPGSMAAMILESTGLSLHGSFVNSGSKLSWFFLPFCRGGRQMTFIKDQWKDGLAKDVYRLLRECVKSMS